MDRVLRLMAEAASFETIAKRPGESRPAATMARTVLPVSRLVISTMVFLGNEFVATKEPVSGRSVPEETAAAPSQSEAPVKERKAISTIVKNSAGFKKFFFIFIALSFSIKLGNKFP
jgi:hypothetical protein